MVASIHTQPNPDVKSHDIEPLFPGHQAHRHSPESQNRVFGVLIRRLGASKTFGENMIFMLNRASTWRGWSSHHQLVLTLADRTAEDLCMRFLVLKVLYLLFTNKATSEYFYTNDLCVLVDVFLRELADLDEDNESVRYYSLLSFEADFKKSL